MNRIVKLSLTGWLTAVLLMLSGCASFEYGKVQLINGEISGNITEGKTTGQDVLERFGEPYGYREDGNRTVMLYITTKGRGYNYFYGTTEYVQSHLISFVFENNVLVKNEIKKIGQGYDIKSEGLNELLRILVN